LLSSPEWKVLVCRMRTLRGVQYLLAYTVGAALASGGAGMIFGMLWNFDAVCLTFCTVVQTGLFTVACDCSFVLVLVMLLAMDFAMAASVEEGGGLLAVGV
jgi:hypothetical protein